MRRVSDDVKARAYESSAMRELLSYGEALGAYCTFEDLEKLLQSLPVPRPFFESEDRLTDLNMRILNSVMNRVHSSPRDIQIAKSPKASVAPRPPLNAEYLLYLFLRKDEREHILGDLIEDYGQLLTHFNKRRADIWFYKQVIGSLLPLLRRQMFRIGALVWLGRILRRLIS